MLDLIFGSLIERTRLVLDLWFCVFSTVCFGFKVLTFMVFFCSNRCVHIKVFNFIVRDVLVDLLLFCL